MQSTSRTFASVAGTFTVVLLTILLAAWSPPRIDSPPGDGSPGDGFARDSVSAPAR